MAFPTGYIKYQEITIDHTKVSANLTDFVIYVNLADLSKAGADIFDLCRSDGGDIRVTKSDGTTELPREIVSIDTTGKTGEMYVKYTGTLSSTVDTVIRVYYNGTDTEPATTATYGRNAVWSNYKLVLHLKEASGTRVDSTGNGFDASPTNTPGNIAGKLGNALSLNGSTQYLSGSLSGMSNTNYTVSAWCSPDVLTSRRTVFMMRVSSAEVDGADLELGTGNGGTNRAALDVNNWWVQTADNAVTTSSFQYVAATVYGTATTDRKLYVNGADATGATTGTLTTNSSINNYLIGTRNASGQYYDGAIDELRLSVGQLSAAYIATDYNNQNSASTFYTVGNEVGGGTSYTKDVDEVITVTETVRRATTKRLSESRTISDTVRKGTSKRRSETVTVTDSVASLLVKLKSIAETITITDATIRKAITKELNEVATITESVRKNSARRLSETITITASAIAATATYMKSLLETVTVTDTVGRITGYARSFVENITITEYFRIRLNDVNALWRELYTDTADAWDDLYTNPSGTWHDKYQDN